MLQRLSRSLVRIFASAFAISLPYGGSASIAADVEAAIEKANAYIEMTKSTERAVESWERYRSWVDMKNGPTGKERYIDYGLYELYDVAALAQEVRRLAEKAPSSAKLDAVMTRYVTAYEALAPVNDEAAAYYDQKAYTADNLAKGKALHATMVPLATAFLAEREAMMPELRTFVREVEGHEVAAIKAREPASAVALVADVMHRLNRVIDQFPRVRPQQLGANEMDEMMSALGPDTPGETFDQIIAGTKVSETPPIDVAAFDAELKAYGEAVAQLDGFSGKPPEDQDDFDEFKPMPRQMLEMLKAFRDPLAKSKGREFEGGGQMVAQIYNAYIEMLNASSPIGITRLRFLP